MRVQSKKKEKNPSIMSLLIKYKSINTWKLQSFYSGKKFLVFGFLSSPILLF